MILRSRWLAVLLVLALVAFRPVPANAQTGRTTWDGKSRFTVLVMGLDRRPSEAQTLSYRTDTIMLISLDPADNRIGVLSIPRDTYLSRLDSDQMAAVNTLLEFGEVKQPGSGPNLTMSTIQYNFGMYVDSYVIFDFNAFIALIDAIGGIDINVPEAIYDPSYPSMNFGYEVFRLPAGMQHLDGATALKYARTRHGDNDFARGKRQLLVLDGVRQKLANPNTLRQLLPQVSMLLQQFQNHVYTGIDSDELIQLAQFAITVPAANIAADALDLRYSSPYDLGGGRVVYIPNRTSLAQLMVAVFGANYAQP